MFIGGGIGYRSSGPSVALFVGIAAFLALVAAIVAYIFVIPESKRPSLNKFLKWLHDFLNVKKLWIESVLRFLYVFMTAFLILFGFLMIFKQPLGGLFIMILGPILYRLLFELLFMSILLVKNVIQINNHLRGDNSDMFSSGNAFAEKLSSKAASAMPKQAAPVQMPGAPVAPMGTPVAPMGTPVAPMGTPVAPMGTPVAPMGTTMNTTVTPMGAPAAPTPVAPTPVAAAPVCPKCGNPVTPGTAFCTRCGSPIGQ